MVASQALTRLCVANGWQWGRMRGGWKGPVPWKFEWIWNQVKKTHIYIIYLPFEHWTMSPSLIVQSWFVKCLQRSVKSMHTNAMFWHILEGIPWDSMGFHGIPMCVGQVMSCDMLRLSHVTSCYVGASLFAGDPYGITSWLPRAGDIRRHMKSLLVCYSYSYYSLIMFVSLVHIPCKSKVM
jgi:hypothetical protein